MDATAVNTVAWWLTQVAVLLLAVNVLLILRKTARMQVQIDVLKAERQLIAEVLGRAIVQGDALLVKMDAVAADLRGADGS